MPQHYRFAIAFFDALRGGDLHPVWVGDTNLGYGDVGVRFYPPLAYYVVAVFRFFVTSWNAAFASAVCFWFFVGGCGVYFWAREFYSQRASVTAGLVFMVMPYHTNQVYNAGLFGEFTALAILPFCFLFVRRIVSGGGAANIAGLAISYALLILTHLPLTLIGSIGLLVYSCVLLSGRQFDMLAIGKLAGSVALAASASTFYWVRMVSELDFVKHTLPEFTSRTYDFRLNFLASVLYVPAEQYEQTSAWFTDLLFLITLAMILPALVLCFRSSKAREQSKLLPSLALVLFVVIGGTPVSAPLWEHVGALQKIQFPWRLLGLLSLAGSLMIAALVEELPQLFRTSLRPAGILAVGLIAAGTAFTFAQVMRPAAYPDRQVFEAKFESYRNDESYECWWPMWAKREAFENRERVSAPSRSVDVLTWTNQEREFSVGDGATERIRVATFYYPHWKAVSYDTPLDVEPADDGTILVSAPNAAKTVRLFFDPPAYQKIAGMISLTTWLGLIAGWIAMAVRRTVTKIA